MSDISNMENKLGDASNRRTCPLGVYDCRDGQFNDSSSQEHYMSEKHQKSLVKCAQQIGEKLNGDSLNANADMKEQQTSLLNAYEQLSVITVKTETIHHDLDRLSADLLRCNNTVATLREDLNNVEEAHVFENAHANAIAFNHNVLRQDVTSLSDQMQNHNDATTQEPDGTMVWEISNVREKMYDAQSERQTSVYSPPFYTSLCGYKLCVRLYLNGDGSARGSHVSIFLVVLRGQYDSLLKWPFSYRVAFCLCDQRTMIETNGSIRPKHAIECFRPDINSISFQQPRSTMNIASGIPKFLRLSELNRPANDNLYVVNDTIFIKTLIDFTGISRSMLPFIFSLDISLPKHIQRQLIVDEMTRQHEHTMN